VKTTVWTKAQPNKKRQFTDCWPQITPFGVTIIRDSEGTEVARYLDAVIARVEYRP